MTSSPILKVLSTLRTHEVKFLLMGGQACVFYGAAEFSRDTDVALLCEPENLKHLLQALKKLQAECIAVPPFEAAYLQRGHAVHFRCKHPDVENIRLDVISVMRNVEPFEVLWNRRTTIQTPEGEVVDMLSLFDLIQAKKTQRDKDWPMIRRLIEADYFQWQKEKDSDRANLWLKECRTPLLLTKITSLFSKQASELLKTRPLLKFAIEKNEEKLADALQKEESEERKKDQLYWQPLKKEIEALRRKK